MGEFMPRPRKKIARGPTLVGMSCGDRLLWLPLRRGARPLLVAILPGEMRVPAASKMFLGVPP